MATKNIPWEKTANKLTAKSDPGPKARPEIYARAMAVAFEKMKEVTEIKANFSGKKHFFEPLVTTFLLEKQSAEFFGIYEPVDLQIEAKNEQAPYFCLRKATWNLEHDKRHYLDAKSKRAYIEGESQISSINLFLPFNAYAELHTLLAEAHQMALRGFSFEMVEREDPPWSEINILLSLDRLRTSIEYWPRNTQCGAIELWLIRWRTFFLQVDNTKGFIPEGGFTVLYPPSLEEQIQLFAE